MFPLATVSYVWPGMVSDFCQASAEMPFEAYLVHACKFAKKEYRVQMRRAKRAYAKHQKAAFLDKVLNKNPELHAMLRQPKCMQPT